MPLFEQLASLLSTSSLVNSVAVATDSQASSDVISTHGGHKKRSPSQKKKRSKSPAKHRGGSQGHHQAGDGHHGGSGSAGAGSHHSSSSHPLHDDHQYMGPNHDAWWNKYGGSFDAAHDSVNVSKYPDPSGQTFLLGNAQQFQKASVNQMLHAHYGLKPLKLNKTLTKEAMHRSKDMNDRHYFAHEIPDAHGSHYAYKDLQKMGYKYKGWGENIAYQGAANWGFTPQDMTTYINEMFMHSPGHRKNVLGNYDSVGLGAYVDPETHKIFYSQEFSKN